MEEYTVAPGQVARELQRCRVLTSMACVIMDSLERFTSGDNDTSVSVFRGAMKIAADNLQEQSLFESSGVTGPETAFNEIVEQSIEMISSAFLGVASDDAEQAEIDFRRVIAPLLEGHEAYKHMVSVSAHLVIKSIRDEIGSVDIRMLSLLLPSAASRAEALVVIAVLYIAAVSHMSKGMNMEPREAMSVISLELEKEIAQFRNQEQIDAVFSQMMENFGEQES